MSTQILSGLISFAILATACNQKKFDAGVASREAQPKTVNQEPAVPAAQPAPAPVTTTTTVETLPSGPDTTVPGPAVDPSQGKPDPAPGPVSEPDKTVEFGAAEIFRIGDGYAHSSSACVGQVNTYKLSGTKYFFQFEVMEDDTGVDLSIGRVCGVDNPQFDVFSLLNEKTKAIELAEKILPKETETNGVPWVPYPAFKLKKGIYSVVIHSKNKEGKVYPVGTPLDPKKDEYDDFIVGNIKVKATKQVKAIKIYAE